MHVEIYVCVADQLLCWLVLFVGLSGATRNSIYACVCVCLFNMIPSKTTNNNLSLNYNIPALAAKQHRLSILCALR